ncbi:hypothetical protein J7I80_04430 [Bacillus sp. ISL-41]|uniref:hypothetical protein n=1 Tax=Bacillus sp. ISL-41 TaxID=2819127 RepID=UPI001BECFD1D|nr:hypothetical protein [Bacillus sp. ISL-41]MBT2641463.1 hypothetical protein [Bacillus sp. ISL-41]
MQHGKIEIYEKESRDFKPFTHFHSRIQEMKNKSGYGNEVARKWTEIVNGNLISETYPVIHPIGKETFSLYAEFPTGVFEYTLDIDGATALIKDKRNKPVNFSPKNIIESVDPGNINKDPNRIKPNHKNPVMVLQSRYLTDNKPYCINGNHRIFKAYRNNDPLIEVFIFKELEFVPFFYDVLSKALYYFEMDYVNIMTEQSEIGTFTYDFSRRL